MIEQAASLPQAFFATADGAPDRVAVRDGERLVTYAELADRARRVAAALRARGIVRGDVVAVHLAPSAECVAAILGVMAAGAAYLPIDVTIPADRRRRYLEIAGARAVVESAPSESGAASLLVDELLARGAGAAAVENIAADALAYVIFTSGSTGEPKGVMCEHGPVFTSLGAMLREGFVTADDCVLWRTSIGFDPSVWEVFAPLLAGGTLAIGSPAARSDPKRLIEDAARYGATVLQVVPTLLEHLVAVPLLGTLERLRFLFTGGETLTPDLARRTQLATNAALVNLYGPTETTVHVTRWVCPRPVGEDIPLGDAFTGAEFVILDDDGRPLPRGEVGEIGIAGACVARGYVNRPELTAARFTHHPLRPQTRMYRTGDRGSLGADGFLRYHGRADRQVKVSGIRIELDEVESVLRDALGGTPGAVVAAKNAFGDKELIAFVKGAVDKRQVRERLARALPAAMLPTRILAVETFPTLSNGKTDYVTLAKNAEKVSNGAATR